MYVYVYIHTRIRITRMSKSASSLAAARHAHPEIYSTADEHDVCTSVLSLTLDGWLASYLPPYLSIYVCLGSYLSIYVCLAS